MADWTDIPNSDVDPGSPGSTALFTALRDNVLALPERSTGAPKILGNAYDYQEFTASGTWTKPSNAEAGDKVYIYIVNGGQGGERDLGTIGDPAAGGIGGMGIMLFADIDDLAATATITVGAGGAGSTTNGIAGAQGGDSRFDDGANWDVRLDQSADSVFVNGRNFSGTVGVHVSDTLWASFAAGYGGTENDFAQSRFPGVSQHAGRGGLGVDGGVGGDGHFPGGGGGGSDGSAGGDGADGVVRVWCVKDG